MGLTYLVYVLAIFGAAYVFGHSIISLPFRYALAKKGWGMFFVTLLECPSCFSVHLGWILTLAGYSPFSRTWHGLLGASMFFAATSFILGRLTGLMLPPTRLMIEETEPDEERHIADV